MILAGAPRSVTDRLQRVLHAAARLVSRQRNEQVQVRPWTVAAATYRLALAAADLGMFSMFGRPPYPKYQTMGNPRE